MKITTRNNLLIFVSLVIVLVLLIIVTPPELDVWIVVFGVLPVVFFAYFRGTTGRRVIGVVHSVAETSRQIRWAEIRKSMATSLNTAFGLTIGLVWSQVVALGFAAAGLPLTAGVTANPLTWGLYVLAAFFVTFVCLLGIYLMSRWKEAAVEKEVDEKEELREEKAKKK